VGYIGEYKMSRWCQNPKCPEKQTSSQVRGTKGKKYYQSNKAYGYGNGNFCTTGCWSEWSSIYMNRALDSLGVRITEPVKVNMENSWNVRFDYQSYREDGTDRYYLVNELHNIEHEITKQQAKINTEEEYSVNLTSAQAGVLAKQLGLTNQ